MPVPDFTRRWKKDWDRLNPVLRDGEPGVEIDTSRLKIGDGRTPWTQLTFIKGSDAFALPSYLDQTALDSRYVGQSDSRLSDWRTPSTASVSDAKVATAANIQQSKIANLVSTLAAKADLVGGLIPTSQIPAIAFTETYTVASQAAMLALTSTQVQVGDVAVRTDGAGSFILTSADPSQLSSWTRLNAPTDVVVSVNGQTGTVVLAKSNIGLGNVDNTSDANKPISTATQTALNAKADLVGGVIPSSQLPSISMVDTYVVASQAAMLALTTTQVQKGDIAVRTDGAGTFILAAADPSVLSNWVRLNAPTDVVTSVAGKTGVVTLASSDVGLGNVSNTSDANKPVSTAQATAIEDVATLFNSNTISGAWSPDFSRHNSTQRRTLSGNITLSTTTPPNSSRSTTTTFVFIQDATGGRTITWPSTIKWPYGQPPVLSTAPGAIDVVTLIWAGEWFGFLSGVAFA